MSNLSDPYFSHNLKRITEALESIAESLKPKEVKYVVKDIPEGFYP